MAVSAWVYAWWISGPALRAAVERSSAALAAERVGTARVSGRITRDPLPWRLSRYPSSRRWARALLMVVRLTSSAVASSRSPGSRVFNARRPSRINRRSASASCRQSGVRDEVCCQWPKRRTRDWLPKRRDDICSPLFENWTLIIVPF
jgi:hypothetical protein